MIVVRHYHKHLTYIGIVYISTGPDYGTHGYNSLGQFARRSFPKHIFELDDRTHLAILLESNKDYTEVLQ